MFPVCACARYQVTPKVSHLHAVKRIFRYLKGQPKLGLWYPKDSPFDLVAYIDSDYAWSSLDIKSTFGGCQFLRRRLISWQCKKQTVVANFTIEADYVTAASYCGQVLWIQNQLLDYGKNMMLYLKNMAGFKMDFSKEMSYEEIRPLFEEEYNKVQTLFKEVPKIDVERIKALRKRTRKEKVKKDQTTKKQKGNELEHDNTEKQKLEEQQKAEEHKRNLEIVHDDEDDVFVNVAHLSSKPQTIMDDKIYKEEKKEHFQIIRENGNHQMHLAFSTMLKNFDREYLEVLWKIVKYRFKDSQPKKVLDVFLWLTLKVMFENTVEDSVYRL
uniref:Putative ribonuclease H-like domain-containing protein n=1 Tax=Tanacetum cinerariifolium TaxID=118510 RepID=A0A6L2MCC9_TANCI|nr:putative ribonuclease H-like domain-containing protein [Tanacetum cinerariifolium]